MNCGKIYNLCLIFAHTCCLNESEKMTGLCIKNTNNGVAINAFSINSTKHYYYLKSSTQKIIIKVMPQENSELPTYGCSSRCTSI